MIQEQLQGTGTVRMVQRDASGNVKPVFQENALFMFLINKGIVSPRFPKVPYLLGRWQAYKDVNVNGYNDSR